MGGAPRDFPLLGCVTIRAPSVRAHDEDACALPTNSFVGMYIEAPARLAPYQFNNLYDGHTKIWIEATSQYRER